MRSVSSRCGALARAACVPVRLAGSARVPPSLHPLIHILTPVSYAMAQMDEMHDYWCARDEAVSAAEGSPVRILCENYEKHKEELKKEL